MKYLIEVEVEPQTTDEVQGRIPTAEEVAGEIFDSVQSDDPGMDWIFSDVRAAS